MEINFKEHNLINNKIEPGDLVIDGINDDAIFMVVQTDYDLYNVIVFDKKSYGFNDNDTVNSEIYINHTRSIDYDELIKEYTLLAKSKDVKITINY